MLSVAFVTAALIIVSSVFNGLEDLLRSLNNSFDPEIKIHAARGKSFEVSDEMIAKIKGVPGVAVVTEVIEDNAYARYRDANQVITMKGVGDNFLEQKRIPPEAIVEGELKLKKGNIDYAIVGRGVQYTLSIAIDEPLYPLQIYYIKNVGSVGMDPSRLYVRQNIIPGGVFSIVQNFDENYIIVPLAFARDLLDYGNRRTSLEIKIADNADVYKVEAAIQDALGSSLTVLNHEEQHKDLYKLLKMEKLFTFLALTLLLIIGSINIFFTLMMLALDKKKDISILSAVGADNGKISRIFLTEGTLIALLGTFVGMVLGGFFCLAQQKYGIISMGMETAITQGYPVKIRIADFGLVFIVVIIITVLISTYPARMAARFAGVKHL
jgi:lipoprotein-releasing system permease protein